jgi:hypothetical protein
MQYNTEKININKDLYSNIHMDFKSQWNVWVHHNKSTDWSLNSYHNIMTITNIKEMWEFLNNFNNMNYLEYQIFVMRDNIKPIWEDKSNINGGAASIRLRASENILVPFWIDSCICTMNENVCCHPECINGISFNLKDDLVVIKIWNDDCENDISKKLSDKLIQKYSIKTIVYIKNRPTK